MKTRRIAVTGVVVGIALIGGIGFGVHACSQAFSDMTSVTGSEGKATLAKFNQIQTGMTYAQVVRIIGGEGTEISRVEIPGAGRTVMYAWDGKGTIGANMSATFQDGRLMSKAQAGLR